MSAPRVPACAPLAAAFSAAFLPLDVSPPPPGVHLRLAFLQLATNVIRDGERRREDEGLSVEHLRGSQVHLNARAVAVDDVAVHHLGVAALLPFPPRFPADVSSASACAFAAPRFLNTLSVSGVAFAAP